MKLRVFFNSSLLLINTLYHENLAMVCKYFVIMETTESTMHLSPRSDLYQINVICIIFPFCKSTENRHVPAPSLCFQRTIDTFSQRLLQVLRAL